MTKNTFPLTINEKFGFVKVLSFPKAKYNFAQYKDKDGNLYFAKSWNSDMGVIKMYQLISEISFYKNYSRVINKRLSTKTGIHIPKYFETFRSVDNIILLIEYVDGKQLRSYGENFKIKKLTSLTGYQMEFSKTKYISGTKKLTNLYFGLVVPILALIALTKNIKRYKEIFTCLFKFYPIKLNTKSRYSLINRDVNTGNMLVAKKADYIIDYQLIAYGPIAHQFANMLYSMWFSDNKEVFQKVFNYITKNDREDRGQITKFLYYAYLFGLSFGTIRNFKKSNELLNLIKTI